MTSERARYIEEHFETVNDQKSAPKLKCKLDHRHMLSAETSLTRLKEHIQNVHGDKLASVSKKNKKNVELKISYYNARRSLRIILTKLNKIIM